MQKAIEQSIVLIGGDGLYQKLLVALFFFLAGEVNYLLIGPSFIFMNPLFRCKGYEGVVDESIACPILNQCIIDNDFTIVARLSLFCDEGQVYRNLIQSIVPVGSIFGLIIANLFSAYYGNKKAMVFVQIVASISVMLTVLGAHFQIVAVLVISQFLSGFSGYSMMIMIYIYPSDIMEDNFRQSSIIFINYAWSITSALLGLFYYQYNQWYNFLIQIVLIPMIAFLIVSNFYLVESPNYLYAKKQYKKSIQSLKSIALINNNYSKFQQVIQIFKIAAQSQQKEIQPQIPLRKIFKSKSIVRMMIVLIFIESGANLYYFGMNFALDQVGYNYGINMISAGFTQLLAFILLSFIITKVPRKWGLIVSYFLIFILGGLFFIDGISKDQLSSFIILQLIRFFLTIGYALVLMVLTESFQVNIQGICAGIVEAAAQSGGLLAPIVITFAINSQIYPIILINLVLLVFVLLPLFFMPKDKVGLTQQDSKSQLLSSQHSQLCIE